jgi:GT2 family glycosyltransferase/predicted SAM-dependent methyltransferase
MDGETIMISIIIPVYNRHEMSHECIQAVMENTEHGTYEIIVIDNGSEPVFVPQFSGFVEIRVIRNEENKGFPVAVNQGIKEAKGDIIILLNNDVIVTPGWAECLIKQLEQYDIVSPVTNYAAGIQKVIVETYNNIEQLNTVAESYHQEHEGDSENVNFVIGFVMVFRKSLYDEFGPFDESLWPSSGEEIDFCFKAVEAGYKVGVAFDVYVHHEGNQTFNDLADAGLLDYKKLCDRNDKHLAEKWGEDFWNNQIRYNKTKLLGEDAIRLNLGCGRYPMKGFINVDQFEEVEPDLLADVLNLPYEANSVDEIYCGHLLEHLAWDEGQYALKHWLNILKPGGEIRIVVPNFDVLAQRYLDYPTPEAMKELNDLYIYSYVQDSLHRYCYSECLLKDAMGRAGFKNIKKMPLKHPYYVDPVDWQVGFEGMKI